MNHFPADTVPIDLVVTEQAVTLARAQETQEVLCLPCRCWKRYSSQPARLDTSQQAQQLHESRNGWAGREIAVKRQHGCVVCVDSSVRFCGRASRAGQPGPGANRQASGGLRSAAERAGETWRGYREQQWREKPARRWVDSGKSEPDRISTDEAPCMFSLGGTSAIRRSINDRTAYDNLSHFWMVVSG